MDLIFINIPKSMDDYALSFSEKISHEVASFLKEKIPGSHPKSAVTDSKLYTLSSVRTMLALTLRATKICGPMQKTWLTNPNEQNWQHMKAHADAIEREHYDILFFIISFADLMNEKGLSAFLSERDMQMHPRDTCDIYVLWRR